MSTIEVTEKLQCGNARVYRDGDRLLFEVDLSKDYKRSKMGRSMLIGIVNGGLKHVRISLNVYRPLREDEYNADE